MWRRALALRTARSPKRAAPRAKPVCLRLFVSSWFTGMRTTRMALESSRTAVLAIVILATFTDIVAYSIAVPVLPDLSRKLGASPTTIGLLFA